MKTKVLLAISGTWPGLCGLVDDLLYEEYKKMVRPVIDQQAVWVF